MTVRDLKVILETMPNGAEVYINTETYSEEFTFAPIDNIRLSKIDLRDGAFDADIIDTIPAVILNGLK